MTEDETMFSRTVLSGINFLICEAENNRNLQVARILKLALRDVCLSLEQKAHDNGEVGIERMLGTDLFLAIQFLSKYASIKDHDLRKDVLREIESVRVAATQRGH
jgi:hypothetical protein